MAFRRHLEETRQVLYHYFEDDDSFEKEVDRHLRAYAKNELPKADLEPGVLVLLLEALNEVRKAKNIALQKTEEAKRAHDSEKAVLQRIEEMQLVAAEDAAVLAMEGQIEYARQKFSKLIIETTNLRILYLAYDFYYLIGDLDSAVSVMEKWLTISGINNNTPATAGACCNLGVLYKIRGNLRLANKMQQRSLAINKELDLKEIMASAYSNLGTIYHTQGSLEQAKEMYQKSLAIEKAIGQKKKHSKRLQQHRESLPNPREF